MALSLRTTLLLFPLIPLVVGVGAWGGAYVVSHTVINLTVDKQKKQVRLPPTIAAGIETTQPIDLQLNGDISTVVPFKETLNVPLKGHYPVDVRLKADIPVEFEVICNETVPVDTMAQLELVTELDLGNVKKLRNLRLTTAVPMKFDLPVNLRVPVKDSILFDYDGPIVVIADEQLSLPVDTFFEPTIAVDQRVTTPVTSRIRLEAQIPQNAIDAELTYAELNIRPANLRLERREK